MDLEEIQSQFEKALAELNEESEKRGYEQKAVICNEQGVFIDFAGVELNYSRYSLEDNLEYYLTQQTEKHESYQRVLQNHKLKTKIELRKFNSSWYSFLQRFSKPQPEGWRDVINRAAVKVAFDRTIKTGALLGKYFFENFAADYTKNKFDDVRKKLVVSTDNIHHIADDIETLDTLRLHYLEHKELIWYGKQS
ncbi:hypothetical protein HY494_01115 [Candidatus Woesearchaeota archaeon]|nr:hypothetical protein [Candidatus Woesearchaeota archaeon]